MLPEVLDPLKIGDFSLIPADRMLAKGDGALRRLTNLELRFNPRYLQTVVGVCYELVL
jgi:hypothetical protein